jgi:phosphohistidine swiveling domain-containing protein
MSADRWITDDDVSPRYPLYTRANAGEVLPDPVSPLTVTTTWRATNEGWLDSLINVGTCEPDEVDVDDVTGLFGGYLYINASIARMFGVRGPDLTAEIIDFTYFGDHPDVPPYVPEDWHQSPENTAKMGTWMHEVLNGDLDVLLDDQAAANMLRAERPDLTRLTDYELIAGARGLLPDVRRLFERHLTVTAGASLGPGILTAIAEAMGDPSITLRLITGVGDIDSALPSRAMWKLSRLDPDSPEFQAGFDAFLFEFGSRGPNEWDLISDVWETKPELALSLINVMRKQGDDGDPAARSAVGATERAALTARLRETLASDPETLAQFDAGLSSSHIYLAGRERAKTNIIKVINEIRVAFRELARRHDIDITEFHMLLDDELDAFLNSPDDFHSRLTQRAVEYKALFDLEPPFIIHGSVPPLSEWPPKGGTGIAMSETGDVLHGVPGCAGVVTGTARVILDPSDPMALEPGDILIAPHTDPAWTPLFVPAAGVVVNVGAQVSHAIIVSRELGIPCVVSVTGATESIPDGATVTVDGGAGTVTVL